MLVRKFGSSQPQLVLGTHEQYPFNDLIIQSFFFLFKK
jgi:hypothetical protein